MSATCPLSTEMAAAAGRPPGRVRLVVKLRDEQGRTSDLVLPGPKGIRFVVGKPGCHSSVWQMWGGKTVADVYIAVKDIVGYQKWSLHPKGGTPGSNPLRRWREPRK
jgi:hypothetical protein